MKTQKLLLCTLLVTFVYIGGACKTLDKTLPPTELPTTETTMTPNLSSTPLAQIEAPIPSPTWIPLPTFSANEAQNLVAELLKDNAGCQLPCWWGLTPGKTSWKAAYQFLSQLDSHISVIDGPDALQFSSVSVPTPRKVNYAIELFLDFTIQDSVIKRIKIYNYDLAPAYHLSNFLVSYGSPDEIYFRTFYPGFQEKKFSFLIDLYYEEGILMEFSGGDETDPIDGIHKNCYVDMYSPFIHLWSPTAKMTATEAIDTFLDNSNFPYPIPLETATDKDITTFYDEFRDPNKVKCLATPQELWQ